MNIKIIGLGGIGSYLSEFVIRYLNFTSTDYKSVTFVDGDKYEIKNLERQNFKGGGFKASNQKDKYDKIYPSIEFKDFNEYITEHNISDIIQEGDLIFLCVDNHSTRKTVNEFCKKLKNMILISGGNEFTDGNTQIFIREDGVNITPTLTDYHDDILNSKDKNPNDMSCEELAEAGSPQLIFANITAAVYMCWLYYNYVANKNVTRNEVYFDGCGMNAASKIRLVK